MTLWVHTLEGRDLTSHSDDHTFLFKFTAELDALCNRLAATPLSTFFDYTDAKANLPSLITRKSRSSSTKSLIPRPAGPTASTT